METILETVSHSIAFLPLVIVLLNTLYTSSEEMLEAGMHKIFLANFEMVGNWRSLTFQKSKTAGKPSTESFLRLR